jgi:hypothetical protein
MHYPHNIRLSKVNSFKIEETGWQIATRLPVVTLKTTVMYVPAARPVITTWWAMLTIRTAFRENLVLAVAGFSVITFN